MAQTAEIAQSDRFQLWLPAAICVLLLTLELVLLFHNLSPADRARRSSASKKLATLVESRNEVRHKSGGTLIWDSVHPGSDFFQNDSVATMSGASAIVEFLDRSVLVIEPDSLVVFEAAPTQDSPNLEIIARLVKGSILRKNGGAKQAIPLVIKMSNEPGAPMHRFNGTSAGTVFRVKVEAYGLKVTVESGGVKVDEGSELAAGQETQFGTRKKLPAPTLKKPSIEIKPKRLPAEGPSARAGASENRHAFGKTDLNLLGKKLNWVRLFELGLPSVAYAAEALAEVSIRFAWEAIPGAKEYRIQISKDPSFRSSEVERDITSTEFVYETTPPQAARDAPAGAKEKLFFRVAGIDSSGTAGEFSAVETVEIEPQSKVQAFSQIPSPLPKPVAPPSTNSATDALPKSATIPRLTPGAPSPSAKIDVDRGQPSPGETSDSDTQTVGSLTDAPMTEEPTSKVTLSTVRTEESSRSYRYSGSLAYGALFQSRTFKGESIPKTVSGSGFIPARIQGELTAQDSTRPLRQFRLGASYVFESARIERGITQSRVAVPVMKAWGLWNFLGFYASNSSEFLFRTGAAHSSFQILGGIALDTASLNISWMDGKLHPRAQIGVIALGAFGADMALGIRREFASNPTFAGFETHARVLNIETALGAMVEVGYAF